MSDRQAELERMARKFACSLFIKCSGPPLCEADDPGTDGVHSEACRLYGKLEPGVTTWQLMAAFAIDRERAARREALEQCLNIAFSTPEPEIAAAIRELMEEPC